MSYFSRLFAASSLALGLATAASATPIAAGGSANPAAPVTTTNIGTVASYTNVAFTSQAVGAPSTFNGTYSTMVYRDSSNNLCSVSGSCLTFAIQVTNSASSTDGIETVTTGPFSSAFTYNVGYVAPATGLVPLNITDSIFGAMSFNFTTAANGTTPGNFANIIAPGSSSAVLIIQTSATNYRAGSISFQDSQTATVAGFLPAVAVTPEPSSLVLLGTGLIGTATTVLRRRKLTA